MVEIGSQWMASYSTSIDPLIVSVTVVEIFDIKDIFPQQQW